MNSIKRCYSDLLSLTQLFLLREYSLKGFTMADPAAMAFFKKKINNSDPTSIHKNQLSRTQQPLQNAHIQVQPKNIPPSPAPKTPPPLQPQSHLTPPLQSQLHHQPHLPQKSSQPLQPPQILQSIPAPSETKTLEIATSSIPSDLLIPSSQAPAVQTHSTKSKQFSLEPWTTIPAHHTEEFWKIGKSLFPEWRLCETIPNDAIAQKNKNAWLKNQDILPVLILSFYDNEQQLTFLKNIAHAISLRLAPARVLSAPQLEKENSWTSVLNSPQLRLVIANDYGLYLQPKLMQFYREVSQQNKHFLNQTPLLLLSDLSLYLKEPQLKPLLWRAICNEFAALQQ